MVTQEKHDDVRWQNFEQVYLDIQNNPYLYAYNNMWASETEHVSYISLLNRGMLVTRQTDSSLVSTFPV